MKNLLIRCTYLIVALLFAEALFASSGTNGEEVASLSQSLENAMEERNFQKAREVMEEIIPLMKEIIKEDKKRLSELKKTDNPDSDPESFKKQLDRKNELYELLKKLVDVSPAALRVKSNLVMSGVKEFIELS